MVPDPSETPARVENQIELKKGASDYNSSSNLMKPGRNEYETAKAEPDTKNATHREQDYEKRQQDEKTRADGPSELQNYENAKGRSQSFHKIQNLLQEAIKSRVAGDIIYNRQMDSKGSDEGAITGDEGEAEVVGAKGQNGKIEGTNETEKV